MLGVEGVRVSRMISTVVLFMVTLVVGILFYRVMVGFFVPLFLAALLVVIFRPIHEWITSWLGNRRRVAALATTIAILLVVLLPAVLVIGVAAAQGTSLVSRVNYNSLAFAMERTREQLGLEIKNIEPFVRMPELIESLGEVESLDEPRQRKAVRDRLSEFEQVLKTFEADFAPLSDDQVNQLAATRESLGALEAKMQALVDADAPQLTESSESSGLKDTADTVDGAELKDRAELKDGAETTEPADDEADEVIDYRSPAEQFQRALVELDETSRELTTLLLGGQLKSQLKIWANPTDPEISSLVSQAQGYLQPRLLWVTSATGEFLIQVVIGISILTIALYFFLVDGPEMVRTLMKLSPLDDRYELRLLLEFDQTSRAVVLATVLSALAQGILAVFGYYFAGLGSIILLFLLTTFMALIPFLGAAAIWIPCALWLGLVEERWGAAMGLAIYGVLVVSSIDNLIKVFVLHGRSQLHPLLALLSVLGGVQVFGPIGILVGPMVVVFLQTTLEILNHELSAFETVGTEDPSPELAFDASGAAMLSGVKDDETSSRAGDKAVGDEGKPAPKANAGQPNASRPNARNTGTASRKRKK